MNIQRSACSRLISTNDTIFWPLHVVREQIIVNKHTIGLYNDFEVLYSVEVVMYILQVDLRRLSGRSRE